LKNYSSGTVLYREVQNFKQLWLWILIVGLSFFSIYGLVSQVFLGNPFGSNPSPDFLMVVIGIIFGVCFPIFFYMMRLITEVRSDAFYFRFFPLHRKVQKIEYGNIKNYKFCTYSPFKEYGGYGIRYGLKGKAYNVSGSRGVQFELITGEKLLIGSCHPEKLVSALDKAMGKH